MMTGAITTHLPPTLSALCLVATFILACLPAQGQIAQTRASAITPISLTCGAANADHSRIVPQQADMLCSALRAALDRLVLPPNAPVALHLSITSATKRSAGLAGAWIFANGQECAIPPLNTRIFDQGGQSTLHTNFIKVFFQSNPVPSAPGISTHSIRNFQCALSAPSASLPTP